jgi:hypothetical protein
MAASITFRPPYTTRKVTLAVGVNVITFPDLPQDGIVSLTVSANAWLVDSGDDADPIVDDLAFDLFTGGVNRISIPGMGRADGVPTIRIGDPSGGTVARFLLTAKD